MSTTRTRTLISLLILIGATLLIIGVAFVFSSIEEETVSMNPTVFDVKPGEGWVYTIYNVKKDEVVHIEFSVSGGSGDIDFYIKDPSGGYIYGPLRVYNSLSYEFKAIESGNYEFVFDNTFSLVTTKRVSINAYIKTMPYLGLVYVGAVLIIIGGIMLGAGLIIYDVTKTSRSRTTSEAHRSQPSEAGAHAPS